MAAEYFSERIREIYRVVLGAMIGGLPFVMFFLMRDANIDLLPAAVLWLLTLWVIISEWWSIEDDATNYSFESLPLNILSMIYLIALSMLTVSLILGLDKGNILQPYITKIVDLSKYNNLQPYIFVFIILSILDMPLSIIYLRKVKEEEKSIFWARVTFDVVLIFLYAVLFFYILPGKNITSSAFIVLGAYAAEWTIDWIVLPRIAPTIASSLENDSDNNQIV